MRILYFKINFYVWPSFLIILSSVSGYSQKQLNSFKELIELNAPSRQEISSFLKGPSWAQFDAETGYRLSNYMPHDGMDNSSTISTIQQNGARTSFLYSNKPCRINTYGDSFTQCHQVSDGETWQEYLAAHMGEPVRNFGSGGYGVYQAYRRMISEEKKPHGSEYIIFYIWGDDHLRSLLRCRYILTHGWNNTQDAREGIGKMFHGNFWPNIEMDLKKGVLIEKNSLLKSTEELYKMTDASWMFDNLKDDLALQMALFRNNEIKDIDIKKLNKLATFLNYPVVFDTVKDLHGHVGGLLAKYSFAATKYILNKAQEFANENNKKLLVVIYDPAVASSLIHYGYRHDQEIVDFLHARKFNYFDMNLVHVEDYKNFNLSVRDYFRRYSIGHYNPAGNHFFAYSIKNKIIEWLNPKPVTYQDRKQQMINFKGYLETE